MGSNEAITGGGAATCQQQAGANISYAWANYSGNNQMTSTSQNVNQSSGYDAAGDITNDGRNQYLYNADGKICAVEWTYNSITVMTGYIYDAEGNRVAKGAITTMSCDPSANGFTTQADYVLDQAGHQLSEFVPGQGGAMAWQHTNVYANGELIATDDTTETHYYLNDWLGTRRVQTDYQGVVEQTCASLPYGDGETCRVPHSCALFAHEWGVHESPRYHTGMSLHFKRCQSEGHDHFLTFSRHRRFWSRRRDNPSPLMRKEAAMTGAPKSMSGLFTNLIE